jgi:peptidoglycan/xylan/chitin deacetylase (PgdA/CDA1 family)
MSILRGALDASLTCLGVVFFYLGLARIVIYVRRKAPRVLMYHACEERESDFVRGLSVNTTPDAFAAHLDHLRKYYRIVDVAVLCQEPAQEFAVAITFDDGLRSVYANAFPHLRSRNLPATCYLVSDLFEQPRLIWLNELNWFLQTNPGTAKRIAAQMFGLSELLSVPRLIQAVIARYEPALIAKLLAELRTRMNVKEGQLAEQERLYVDRDEIEEMSQCRITFGNHSASHAVLSRLDEVSCRDEIERADSCIRNLPGSIRSLAYPFGRVNEETRRIAIELGYTSLMEVEGDNQPFDRLRIGRVNVTTMSPAELFARMEVTAPAKLLIKRVAIAIQAWLRSRFG